MDRRHFIGQFAQYWVSYSFLDLVLSKRLLAGGAPADLTLWHKRMMEICKDLRTSQIPQIEWQRMMEELNQKAPIRSFLSYIDFDRVVQTQKLPHDLGWVKEVALPPIEGITSAPQIGRKIFVYKKGAATPPHAHTNMVSAHWVIHGKIHARTFNRVRDVGDKILIQPSLDRIVGKGETISMSEQRDNVHWFVGESSLSASFDVPVPIEACAYNQIFLDPTSVPDAKGLISAPIISFEDSVKKFGGKA